MDELTTFEEDMTKSVWTVLWTLAMVFLAPTLGHAEWINQNQTMGDGNDLVGVAAVDDQNAVAVGIENTSGSQKPIIYWTKNGGDAWQTTALPGQFAFALTVTMPDQMNVWAAGLGIFKSSNGGQGFEAVQVAGMGMFAMMNQIYAPSSNYIYGVAESKVYFTPNAGLGWDSTDTGIDPSLICLHFINNTTGWVAGGTQEEVVEQDPYSGQDTVIGYNVLNDGVIMKTTDGGHSFTPVQVGTPYYYTQITFIDENIGLAVASTNEEPSTVLRRTTDGGQSWTNVSLPTHERGPVVALTKPVMVNPVVGYVGGSVGQTPVSMGNSAVILKTTDGGSTWKFVPEAERQGGYYGIAFPCEHAGFAVGNWHQIIKFDDGQGCNPGPIPGEDVTTGDSTGGDVVDSDVWTWGKVVGTFGDDALITPGSAPGNETGDDVTSDGLSILDPDNPNCQEVKESSGCSISTQGSGLEWFLLLALLLAGIALRRRTHFGVLVVMVALGTVALTGCGSESTKLVCEEAEADIPSSLPDLVSQEDTGTATTPFACGLGMGEAPAVFGNTSKRTASMNNLIAYVKQHAEGGSDIYLTTDDGSQEVALTRFNDPEVSVLYPSWSPDRQFLAFISNYRATFSSKRWNVFVVSVDGSACYAITPGVDLMRVFEPSMETATVTGSFRFGTGAIANPVVGGTVAHTGGTTTALTAGGGAFTVAVPPGSGTLVLRGVVNGVQVVGTTDYEVEDGGVFDAESVVAQAEPEVTYGPLYWSLDGATLYTLIDEQIKLLYAINSNTGEKAPFLDIEEDTVATFSPFPDEPWAAVAYRSQPNFYEILDLSGEEPETLYEFTFDGQTADSVVTISPMRFLASVQGDKVILLGANGAGDLEAKDITPGSLSGILPEQIDWSLTGDKIVLTVSNGDKTNLLVVDINDGTSTAITSDGLSSMPAWFGK